MDAASPAPARPVISLSPGRIRLAHAIFAEPDGPDSQRFLGAVLMAGEVGSVRILPAEGGAAAEILFDAHRHEAQALLPRLAAALAGAAPEAVEVVPSHAARDHKGVLRYHRVGRRITGWRVLSQGLGRVRLANPVLHRKAALVQAVEHELMNVLGIDRYNASAKTCLVDIEYDPRQLTLEQLVEILDAGLLGTEHPAKLDRVNRDLTVCTVALPVAALAQFAAPVLMPVSGALLLWTSIPSFSRGWKVLTRERRLGVDVLDSIVVLACLGAGQMLPGAVISWCLAFGRDLVKRTENSSKKLLLGAFGKQPRHVWLLHEGQEVQVPVEKLKRNDVVVVHTGEMVPVDGVIVDGLAMLDQHALTGESTPAEKGVGDRVFASSIMVAGRILVSVAESGAETATAKIAQILQDTAGYKLASQHKGEKLADQMVLPTLAAGAVGLGVLGPQGATAVLNSDMGTAIRMAAPLAMLSTLALCAQRGILVKDGRALDLLNEVDTVLFDKTGTLTRERPEVGRIIAVNGQAPEAVLRYAAAAERRFHHPIALAILQRAAEDGLSLPQTDATEYKVGYGITVGVAGHRIRVGSRRFIEMEGIAVPPEVEQALDEAHREGNTMVLVAVDGALGGALELRAAVRPEVPGIIAGLRQRGIRHIAIISGDHEAPTRKLAEQLGMDRHFAQVLPTEKADYVARLQQEGRKVCFVGDGINDAIALKTANVSISLRGATSIATDTAQIVFMEQGLGKLCELRDIARDLERNIRLSWGLIVTPNLACILGAFTLGFGIAISVFTNNVSALAALANGIRPMRKVALLEAERRHLLELQLRAAGFGADGSRPAAPPPAPPATAEAPGAERLAA